MLAGRPKIGKSWLALQLAVAVAEGGAFLEQPVTLRGAVLYLALEDTAQRLKERVEIVRPRRDAPIRFITEWPALNWEAGGLGQLFEKIKVVKPKLVVIDTLASALQRGPAGAKAAEGLEVIVELRKMAHDCGCAVVAVPSAGELPRIKSETGAKLTAFMDALSAWAKQVWASGT